MKGMLIVVLAMLPALAVHAENEQADNETAKPPCALGFCMGPR